MKYLFCDDASNEQVKLRGDAFNYIKKVRRARVGDVIDLRHEADTTICYRYEISAIDAKSVHLTLRSHEKQIVVLDKSLTLGWCIIESSSIEKVLPMLNEIGVRKIVFITCERSQRNFKLDFKRFRRMLKASMQQCGRTQWMEFEHQPSLEAFLEASPTCKILDFSAEPFHATPETTHLLIGCEGGFSEQERALFTPSQCFSLPTGSVLRSQSAAVVATTLQLLG